MKKLLLLLLLPTTLLSQTFYEIKMINSLDDFKKVMIENQYEFDEVDEDGSYLYGYGLVKDSINGNKSEKWGNFRNEN